MNWDAEMSTAGKCYRYHIWGQGDLKSVNFRRIWLLQSRCFVAVTSNSSSEAMIDDKRQQPFKCWRKVLLVRLRLSKECNWKSQDSWAPFRRLSGCLTKMRYVLVESMWKHKYQTLGCLTICAVNDEKLLPTWNFILAPLLLPTDVLLTKWRKLSVSCH